MKQRLSIAFFLFLTLLSLFGCFARSTMMSRETFDETYIGTPVSQVIAKSGEPYSVHKLGGGREEYEYIETIAVDNQLVAENHYFLTIANGQVVAKRMTTESRPAYDLIYQEDANYPSYP